MIVDTSGTSESKRNWQPKKKPKQKKQEGLSEEVINRVEATVTIDYTDEEVDALLGEFANFDPNIEAYTDLVNNLKTSYDLDPTKLADGIIDNADSAADNLETMQTAESLGVDPSTIAKQPERCQRVQGNYNSSLR